MHEQLSISYSHEGVDFGGALETAGGIARALPQLGPVFWLAAGDVQQALVTTWHKALALQDMLSGSQHVIPTYPITIPPIVFLSVHHISITRAAAAGSRFAS